VSSVENATAMVSPDRPGCNAPPVTDMRGHSPGSNFLPDRNGFFSRVVQKRPR
jgi:hypothetical protein